MADDNIRRDPPDLYVITLTEEWEVRYWCDRFGVRPRDLKRAVRAVGNNAEDVKRYIRDQIQRALKESAAEGD
jgi:hypothetical protein